MQKKESTPMCISVDWLQVFTLCAPLDSQDLNFGGRSYKLIVEDGQTPLFQRMLKVVCNGRKYATILQEPRNKVITARATMIKVENRVLYCEQFVQFLYDLMSAIGARYKGITRLDLCCDFNKLYGGRNIQRFIKSFVSGTKGVAGDIVRVGSNKFMIIGSKDNVSKSVINSIRFGSFKSKVGAYMYNKTLELKEVKDKPWIRDVWAQAGLENSEKCPVWRAEISIKSEGMDVLNMDSGELFRLSPRFLEYKSSIERLFKIYANKALHFRTCTGQKNKRFYKDMDLFGNSEMTCRPYYVSKSADTGRTEKVCANKLRQLMEEYSDIAGTDVQGINTAIKFLLELNGYKSSIARAKQSENELSRFKATTSISLLKENYKQALDAMINARLDCTHMDIDAAWQIMAILGAAEPLEYDDNQWESLGQSINLAEQQP